MRSSVEHPKGSRNDMREIFQGKKSHKRRNASEQARRMEKLSNLKKIASFIFTEDSPQTRATEAENKTHPKLVNKEREMLGNICTH